MDSRLQTNSLKSIVFLLVTMSIMPSMALAVISPVSRERGVNVVNPNSTIGFVDIRDSGSGAGPVFNETAQLAKSPGFPFLNTLASQRSEITQNFISASGRLLVQGTPNFDSGYRAQTALIVFFDVAVNTPYTLQLRTTSTPGTVTDPGGGLVLGRTSPSNIDYFSYAIFPNELNTLSGILVPGRYQLSFNFFFINQPPNSPVPDSLGDTTYSFTLLVPAPTSAVSLAALGVLALRRRR